MSFLQRKQHAASAHLLGEPPAVTFSEQWDGHCKLTGDRTVIHIAGLQEETPVAVGPTVGGRFTFRGVETHGGSIDGLAVKGHNTTDRDQFSPAVRVVDPQ